MGYSTGFGSGVLIWESGLLVAHELPGLVAHELPGNSRRCKNTPAPLTPGSQDEKFLVRQLESYFSGKQVTFNIDDLPLDRTAWTSFQQEVADALVKIPYGLTTTYAALAAKAGHPGAQRAVGNFMAANSFPVIIPCHRVIRSDGSFGRYSAGDDWKPLLLGIER